MTTTTASALRIHLLSLTAGSTFQLDRNDPTPYRVCERAGGSVTFRDAIGVSYSARALALRNGGSMFVQVLDLPAPLPEGGSQ